MSSNRCLFRVWYICKRSKFGKLDVFLLLSLILNVRVYHFAKQLIMLQLFLKFIYILSNRHTFAFWLLISRLYALIKTAIQRNKENRFQKFYHIIGGKTEKLSVLYYYIQNAHNMIYFDRCIMWFLPVPIFAIFCNFIFIDFIFVAYCYFSPLREKNRERR